MIHLSGTYTIFATERTVDILQEVAHHTVPVMDVQDLMTRFTMDAASEFLFGKCLDTLNGQLPLAGHATLGNRGSTQASDAGSAFGGFVLGELRLFGLTGPDVIESSV